MVGSSRSRGISRGRITSDTKRFFTLRFLYQQSQQDPERYSNVHRITQQLQRDLDRSLRDDDIKAGLEQLLEMHYVVDVRIDDAKGYRISERGVDFWKRTGKGLVEYYRSSGLNLGLMQE